MNRKNAFTLIELLVVIAIIGLLLAVVIPALQKAKQIAAAAVCLANESNLSKAWLSYSEDNKSYLMEGDTGDTLTGRSSLTIGTKTVDVWCFTADPQDPSGVRRNSFVDDQARGFAKGALWSYMGGAYKAYNCPADKRWTKPCTATALWSLSPCIGGYRSYSMGAPLSQWTLGNGSTTGEAKYVVTKMSEFVSPSAKFVWMEEADPRGWNHRTWNIWLTSVSWYDPLAIWHNGASTFGYADGHAERYKWTGPETRKFFNPENQIGWNVHSAPVTLTDPKDIIDYNWFVQGYIPGRRK